LIAPKESRQPPRIEAAALTKRFGATVANRRVDLRVEPGTVHAVVGENGAGKTTLMRCFAGLEVPDEGEIRLNGVSARLRSVKDALGFGVGMVHQEFSIVDELTLAENLILGVEPARRGIIDRAEVKAICERWSERTGWEMPWEARASLVGIPVLQRLELIRQLQRGADMLILDEPTSVLGPVETEVLLRTIRELRDQGVTVLFISHKLHEVMAVADMVTVMRDGEVVETVAVANTDTGRLARAMIGGDVSLPDQERSSPPGEATALLEGLSYVDGLGVERLEGASLEVRAGEILGVYGVAGSGQEELAGLVMGLLEGEGTVNLGETDLTRADTGARRDAGIAFIASDRKREGLAFNESVEENAVAGSHRTPRFSRRGWKRQEAWRRHAEQIRDHYDIRLESIADPVAKLSGGNQQRLVVGREIEAMPRLLIAVDPTRGVDVQGVAAIHRFLIALRDRDCAILLVSHDLDEVLDLSDRVAVMLNGRVTGIVDRGELSRSRVADLMTTGSQG
jgi:simple sugar transport system ATP-binding protein